MCFADKLNLSVHIGDSNQAPRKHVPITTVSWVQPCLTFYSRSDCQIPHSMRTETESFCGGFWSQDWVEMGFRAFCFLKSFTGNVDMNEVSENEDWCLLFISSLPASPWILSHLTITWPGILAPVVLLCDLDQMCSSPQASVVPLKMKMGNVLLSQRFLPE